MLFSLFSLAASASVATAAAVQGFNYGSTLTTGAPKNYDYFKAEFNQAKGLAGTNGAFTSARLYTSIQAGTTNSPIEAFQAAIDTHTRLLLGLWASAGEANIQNEIAAIKTFIAAKGEAFTSLIDGISVGSEDLYRTSPIGIRNKSGIGALAADVANYINQVKQAVPGVPVGHVDTYTAYIQRNDDNTLTNQAVIDAADFIGTDAYPYFQDTVNNPIELGEALFDDALGQTRAAVGNKPIWITETGWPVSGPNFGKAVPSIANAKTYWDAVACKYLGQVNTWWYTLQDAVPDTPSPSFGLIGAGGGTTPLYDLSCSGKTSTPPPAVVNPSAPKTNTGAKAPEGMKPAPAGQGSAPADNKPADKKPAAPSDAQVDRHVVPTYVPAPDTSSSSKDNAGKAQPNTGAAPAPAKPAPATSQKPAPAPAAHPTVSGACPADLSGTFEFPHLIIAVDSSSPDTAPGTSYNGTITSTISSIYNFDIPPTDAGKQCTLVFLFPEQKDLVTSAFDVSGSGNLEVKGLETPADEQTSFANAPKASGVVGTAEDVKPGNSYTIATGECKAGARIGYEVSATGDLALEYFQDYNPSPIGLYITVC